MASESLLTVRRTTTVDVVRDRSLRRAACVSARGQDQRFDKSGGRVILDGASFTMDIALAGLPIVEHVRAEPSVAELNHLVGQGATSGFRRRLGQLPPDVRGSVLNQLLDDVPVALLVSAISLTVVGKTPIPMGNASGPRVDVCAGLSASALQGRDHRLDRPAPLRPMQDASPLPDGEIDGAWHSVHRLPAGAVRRHRLLDVWQDAQVLSFDAFFRDTLMSVRGVELTVHEYRVTGQLEPDGVTLAQLGVDPVVLPWEECPSAAASAYRLLGGSVQRLRSEAELACSGTSGCTHLTDLLRSLADVPRLADALTR